MNDSETKMEQTSKEEEEERKERHNRSVNTYRSKNREKILSKQREYNQTYRENNREEYNKAAREQYKKDDRIFECPHCGSKVKWLTRKRHLRTNKCLKAQASLSQLEPDETREILV